MSKPRSLEILLQVSMDSLPTQMLELFLDGLMKTVLNVSILTDEILGMFTDIIAISIEWSVVRA